jgi:diguanylate cyclase (GGDEF)-like protein/PAS domain S-box-containing protein
MPIASPNDHTLELAAEALLREHPDALVCGLASNGLIMPIPQSVGLWGQGAIEGRAVTDVVVASDRGKVVELWGAVKADGAVSAKVRLLSKPSRWMTLHFLDLSASHDVFLGIILPSDEEAEEGQDGDAAEELPPAAPRFCTLIEDEGAKVLDCDDAFTQMFGYTAEELIGNSVLDQIHPDDQGRAVEGWIAMMSTRVDQLTRLRRKRRDGSFMWIDTTLHNYLNEPDRNHVLVEIIDVSAEMAAQEALEEQGELLRRITDAMPVGLLQLDTEQNVTYHNARLLSILRGDASNGSAEAHLNGASDSEVLDSPPPSVTTLLATVTTQGVAVFQKALTAVLDEGIDQDVEVDFVVASGDWRCALMSIRALLKPTGEVSGAITSVLDVTENVRARQELEKRATFDALTGCHNRSSILGMLQRELEQRGPALTGLIYVDLDDFKPVNDTLGHAAGDELLAVVAERLRAASRRGDDVGRLGGDEFVVLLRDVPGAEVAMQAAERVREALNAPTELSCGPVGLSASLGVACAAVGETISADRLVQRADVAMYRSKEQGDSQPVLDSQSLTLAAETQSA